MNTEIDKPKCFPDNWTVVIVSDDEDLERLYRMPSNSTIEEISTKWRGDVGIYEYGRCIFMSVDEALIYPKYFSLEMIGEALPKSKIINLRIKLLDQREPQREPGAVDNVYLYQDGKCNSMDVQPTTKLWSILPRSRRIYACNGEVLNLNETVEQAGLVNGSVIYEAEQKIAVRLSTGQIVSTRVPKEALVSDLIAKVKLFVEGRFSLTHSGRSLSPDDPVKDLTKVVEVCPTEFSVTMGDVRVQWRIGSGLITFRQFISGLSEQCHFDEDALEMMTFCCVGCGRKLLKSEKDFQVIQTKCCQVESLELRAAWPVSFEDTMAQTRNAMKHISIQCTNEVKDVETQVYIEMQDGEAQCGVERKNMETQIYLHKRNKLIQNTVQTQEMASQADKWSDPRKDTSPVLIAGFDEGKRDEVYFTTDLPTPVTVASVKKAVKKNWNWSSDRLLVYREIGTRETRKCVQVCTVNDVWLRGMEREFSDIEGNSFMGDQVSRVVGDDFEVLLDDAPIPLLGKRRNIIFANHLRAPNTPVPLYVQNERGGGQDFTLILPKSLYVDILRRVIADRLKVHWDELKLFRWKGVLPDGRRCVHVCNNSTFTSGNAEDAEFGTDNGITVRKNLLKKAERTALGSNEEIKAFPGRRAVVIVASARWRFS